MVRYYVHLPLPQELRDKVMAIRKKYSYESKSDPHITLIAPSQLIIHRSENELIEALRLATKKLSQFPVLQKDIYYFGDKEMVCVRIEASAGFGLCRGALVRAWAGILEPPSGPLADLPNPHVTLLVNIPVENRERVWSELGGKVVFFQFTCDQIVLLRRGESDDRWRAIAIFPIGG